MAFAMHLKCAYLRQYFTDIDISTWLKFFDILLKTDSLYVLLILYSANKLSCRLPFAIYLTSVWSPDLHRSSVDKLVHSDKDSAVD